MTNIQPTYRPYAYSASWSIVVRMVFVAKCCTQKNGDWCGKIKIVSHSLSNFAFTWKVIKWDCVTAGYLRQEKLSSVKDKNSCFKVPFCCLGFFFLSFIFQSPEFILLIRRFQRIKGYLISALGSFILLCKYWDKTILGSQSGNKRKWIVPLVPSWLLFSPLTLICSCDSSSRWR